MTTPIQVDMSGKTALVTGATNGIGKAAAMRLASMGATVIVAGRSKAKADEVAAAINAAGRGRAETALADLATLAGARALAADVASRFSRLDVLINNAGAFFQQRQVTSDGLEMTFALNHMSYFVVTNALLPLLKQSGPSRIVSVASDAHLAAKLNFDDLQTMQNYRGFVTYGASKLANIAFTYELARRLKAEGSSVVANAIHPGFVGTGFAQNNGMFFQLAMGALRPFIRTPEQGADTAVWLATAPEVAGQSGGYYADRKLKQPNAQARDAAVWRKLWEVSEGIMAGQRA